MRPRADLALAAAAVLLVLGFLVSFALGLGSPTHDAAPLPADPGALSVPDALGTVEVLNGSGRNGLARAATARLRDAGVDVVFFGNAAVPFDSSVVFVRGDDERAARAAAARLGIARVTVEPDSTLLLDATVVIGADWFPVPPAAPIQHWKERISNWFSGAR